MEHSPHPLLRVLAAPDGTAPSLPGSHHWTTPRSAPLSSRSEMKLRLGHVATGLVFRQARLGYYDDDEGDRAVVSFAEHLHSGCVSSRRDRLANLTSPGGRAVEADAALSWGDGRSEEHTSELQSPCNLVCRLLLE